MPIKFISTTALPPLGDVSFNCDGRVNLFIGQNASGKSTILRGINYLYSLRPEPVQVRENRQVYSYDFGYTKFSFGARSHWAQDDSGSMMTIWDAVPFLYISATRINLPLQDVFYRTIDMSPELVDEERTLEGLMHDHFRNEVGNFEGIYIQAMLLRMTELGGGLGRQNPYKRAVDIGYSCAKSICPEVMRGDVPELYVDVPDVPTETSDLDSEYIIGHPVAFDMGVVTSDDPTGPPLYAGALSTGTQGTLLWVWALALKMAYHYDWEEGWEKKSAILLIDEVENHLHPTWQRRVIPALLEHFPGLQIFATTHSPFVVAGLKAGQVHLLSRDENDAVNITTNTEAIIGWTADEILRTMMGVEEPTDQLTVDRANRLRQLREKETLTTEEESEMNGLRRQVNEDLLSKSGPLEAQRERYADLMQGFLLSRQSELSQDGE